MNDRSEVILIADDDEDIIKLIELNLRLEDYQVLSALDGEEALEVARERKPHLVILDVMMPKMDGFEVCERLRVEPRTKNTSIIMLTAKSMSADKVVGLTAGADDYIIKPFDPVELVARVKSALRRAREMRDVNPLTELPGNVQVQEEVSKRVTAGRPFAVMYIDLDNFKAFNDYYGFLRGDEGIKLLGRVVSDAIAQQDHMGFVGHVGGDDFIAVVDPQVAEDAAKHIVEEWDREIAKLYDPDDVERGYIEILDRKKQMHRFPITSVSIGIATNTRRPIVTHWEASEIASEMKSFAKRQPGSSYAVDRRGPG